MKNPYLPEIISEIVSSPRYLDFLQMLKNYDIKHIYDTHAHISSGKNDLVPEAPVDLVPQNAFSIEDICLLYDALFGNAGIKYTPVVFDTPLPAYNLIKKNDELLSFCNSTDSPHYQNIIPFAVITPDMESREIEEWVAFGMKGFKMTPRIISSNLKRGVISDVTLSEMLSREALRIAHQQGLPLVVHLPQLVVSPRMKSSLKDELLQIATEFSNLKIILAHLGQAQTPAKIRDLTSFIDDNALHDIVWMDISAVTIPSVLEIAFESNINLLFGTDIDFALVERGRYVMFKLSGGKRVLAEDNDNGNVITALVSQNFGQQLQPFALEGGIDLDAPLLLFQFESIVGAIDNLRQKGIPETRVKEVLENLFCRNAQRLV